MIELTAEQLQALDNANGSPPIVVDTRTQDAYVLVRAEIFERLQKSTAPETGAPIQSLPADSNAADIPGMDEGIKRAKAALRRDLPELLASRRTRGKYVCYHLEKRVGISKDYFALIRECKRRNFPRNECTIEKIAPDAGSMEVIEIETMSNV